MSGDRAVHRGEGSGVVRLGDRFLTHSGELLGSHGFFPDPGTTERVGDNLIFYHYTRPEHVHAILAEGAGLVARHPAAWATLTDNTSDAHLAEGFLNPLPQWLKGSPYFGDLGMELTRAHVGDLLLRVQLPATYPNLFVVDYAHALECKHATHRGHPVLGLGYDCRTGREAVQAVYRSRVPMQAYDGGHIAPVVEVVRYGPGIAVPSQFIAVSEIQPLRIRNSSTHIDNIVPASESGLRKAGIIALCGIPVIAARG